MRRNCAPDSTASRGALAVLSGSASTTASSGTTPSSYGRLRAAAAIVDAADEIAIEPSAARPDDDTDRGPGVVAAQFSELPLPSEQPQRVVNSGGEADVEVVGALAGLQPRPGGDRRHLRSPALPWP